MFTPCTKNSHERLKNQYKVFWQIPIQEKIKTNAFNLVEKNHDLSVMEAHYYQFYQNLKN